MAHPLWAHHLKLRRAYEHLHDLEKNINVFVAEQGEGLRESFEERDGIWWYVIGSEPVVATPYWGVIVGDFAHNLRSLLDQLVWSLVKANSQKPIRANAFPMFGSWNEWDSKIGLHGQAPEKPSPLQGVSVEATAEILWAQPDHPGNEPLELLSWLSNTDKHRLVHPSSVTSGNEAPVGLIKHPDGSVEELTDLLFHPDVPLETGAERVIEVRLPDGFTIDRADYVSVSRFPVDVAFGKRRVRLRDFKELYEFVSRLLQRFGRQFF